MTNRMGRDLWGAITNPYLNSKGDFTQLPFETIVRMSKCISQKKYGMRPNVHAKVPDKVC